MYILSNPFSNIVFTIFQVYRKSQSKFTLFVFSMTNFVIFICGQPALVQLEISPQKNRGQKDQSRMAI
jgi:hypothetical protein